MPGTHRAAQRGTTGEFTEFRAYRQGDDPRRIDWRLLARSDRAYVRITDERAWWPTWLLVDASASMAFPTAADAARLVRTGTVSSDKWNMARALTVGLAAVAHATGDPVGLWAATRPDARRLAPRTRRGTVQAIASALDAINPQADAPLTPLLARVPTGARIVLITDALGDTDALVAAIARAGAAGSDVTLVHVIHPFELSLPQGFWRAIDPESVVTPRPVHDALHSEYRRNFDGWRSELVRRCLAAGARYHDVLCDEPAARAVRRITGAAMRAGA
jgi:uncharacterized protein (DUF58 family)